MLDHGFSILKAGVIKLYFSYFRWNFVCHKASLLQWTGNIYMCIPECLEQVDLLYVPP